jgi:sugar phosphate isomerase/epimerase
MRPLSKLSRREALQAISATLLASAGGVRSAAQSARPGARRMSINLVCGAIGVQADQRSAVELAHAHGFESVEAMPSDLARMSPEEVKELLAGMKSKNLGFGAAGLPVEFRQDEGKFVESLKAFPKLADALQRAGVTRVGTWITPGSNSLTYLQNFKQHARRLREIVEILRDRGMKLGLEYVGTKTLRDRFHYEFIHTMAETKELIAEIKLPEVGFVLDSWHWWNADETADDILTLKGEQVVAVDLNDAPAGIPKEQQVDGRRELPLATGVINASSFLNALNKIGYDGPVRAEPFNKALNDLDNDAACAKASEALHKAFELIKT